MKNKEAYIDEIVELLAAGDKPALKNGILVSCASFCCCNNCDFNDAGCGSKNGINRSFTRWANEEFVVPEANWDLVPLDTPIYVWNEDDGCKIKICAHFAGIGIDGSVYAWQNGKTSFTNPDRLAPNKWKHAELTEFHAEWTKRKEG